MRSQSRWAIVLFNRTIRPYYLSPFHYRQENLGDFELGTPSSHSRQPTSAPPSASSPPATVQHSPGISVFRIVMRDNVTSRYTTSLHLSVPLTMDSPASSPSASSARPTFACIRCSERKVRCDKQSPCNSCVRHNVECIFRPPKLLRKRQECAIDKRILSRLKRYETILREKGIDPNKISNIPEEEQEHESSHAEVAHTPWTLSPEAKVFKPKLLHGQNGTELVDK